MTTIVIGVDATARSEDAIAFARSLGSATAAKMIVASVVHGPATPGSRAREEAHLTVRRMSGLLAGLDPERIHTGVFGGASPAEGLRELAATEAAALLVVGSTHTGHLGRVHPGSTGERLLTGAPCAVAVVPHGHGGRPDRKIRRVGVAYDGSAESRVALEAGAAAARALRASLQVISVIPADVYGAPALMGGVGHVPAFTDVAEDIRRDLDATVAGLPSEVRAEGLVLEGRPWRELASASADLDLLFVGSRGYGPLQAVVVGGTSGRLLREARCPVIALPRGADAATRDLFTPGATITA